MHATYPLRPVSLLVLLLAGPALGALTGIFTNLINARVSPYYFAAILGWNENEAPRRAIGQGALEGVVLGLFFGVFFSIAVAASTRLRCDIRTGTRPLMQAVIIVLIAWFAGGVAGVAFAGGEPRTFSAIVIAAPSDPDALMRYGWVGGSIWGAYLGTILALIVSTVSLHVRWRKRLKQDTAGFPVAISTTR